eukprot:COSAG05_NODE_2690_length_2768_cov_2.750468_2_plen_41_part_00
MSTDPCIPPSVGWALKSRPVAAQMVGASPEKLEALVKKYS